jgi:hypothetical protein
MILDGLNVLLGNNAIILYDEIANAAGIIFFISRL